MPGAATLILLMEAFMKWANMGDKMAETVAQHSDRFDISDMDPLQNMEMAVAEMANAVTSLDFHHCKRQSAERSTPGALV